MKILIVLLSVFLTACGSLGLQPTWAEAWTDTGSRTDLFETDITLDIVPFKEMRERCFHLSPIALGCYTEDRIVMQSYNGDWPEGTHVLKVKFQFVEWDKIGNKVWSNADTIYTYEHSISSGKMVFIGAELVSMFGLPPDRFNAEKTLAHEVFHGMGYEDVKTFRW